MLRFQALSSLLLSSFSVPSTHHFLHQEVSVKETVRAPGREVFCDDLIFAVPLQMPSRINRILHQ